MSSHRHRGSRAWAAVFATVLGSGCAQLAGIDDFQHGGEGTGGSGAATVGGGGAGGAGGGCVPDCEGRSCGSDGCDGTCGPGCGDAETCTASGTCVCPPWAVVLPDGFGERVTLDNGRLYTAYGVGGGCPQARVVQIAACDGATVATRDFVPNGAACARPRGVAHDVDGLYVVGSLEVASAVHGWYGRLALDDLSDDWHASSDAWLDQMFTAVAPEPADRPLWLSGIVGARVLVGTAQESGLCAEVLGVDYATVTRPVIGNDEVLVATNGSLNEVTVRRTMSGWDPDACVAPTVTSMSALTPTDGENFARDLELVDGSVVVVGEGKGTAATSSLMWLARQDLGNQSSSVLLLEDATSEADRLTVVRHAAGALFVAGTVDSSKETPEAARGFVRRYSWPPPVPFVPTWEHVFTSLHGVLDLAIDDAAGGRLYVLGSGDGSSALVTCTTDGECAELP